MSQSGVEQTDDPFVLELRRDFLNEVTFLLEESEESFLKLEDETVRAEELKKIFRLAHSIKGSGTAVGYHDLAKFAHAVEDLLSILRVHPEWLTTEINSLLLTSNDAFKERIRMFREESAEAWDVSQLQAQIESVMQVLKARLDGIEETADAAAAPMAGPAPMEPASAAIDTEVAAGGKSPDPALPADASAVPSSSPVASAATPPMPADASQKKTSSSGAAGGGSGGEGMTSIKVDVSRLESVLDLVGELVVIKSQLSHTPVISSSADNELKSIVNLLDKTVRELQDRTLAMRMTSLKPLFLKVQRVIRDLGVKLGKPVDFHMEGDDTEIDRTMIEILTDPLIHLARNAVDHGVESPERRQAANKPAVAKVSLVAKQANGRVVIELSDDGGGIIKEKVLNHAKKKGLVPQSLELASIPERDVFDMIFLPGFSTADKVTDVSGRGVGLDVVKSNIEKIRGRIEIDSVEGKGSIFRLSLPFTTAITDGLLTRVGRSRYIVPLSGIREIVRTEENGVTVIENGVKVIGIRGRFLPLIDLEVVLGKGHGDAAPEKSAALIVEHAGELYAFKVDEVLGQTQVVVKGLGDSFDSTCGVSGGAILGDGCVSLVLDTEGVLRTYKNQLRSSPKKVAAKAAPTKAA